MHLTPPQRAAFASDGFLSPLPVFSPDEVRRLRASFEGFEAAVGGIDKAVSLRTDVHLLQRWAWDVVQDRRIVDPVTDVLGPDVLLWSCNWFIKEPRDHKFVTFHQDATYWGLEPHDVVTAWVALSDAGVATGPMQFLPGSHSGSLLPHENTHAEGNLLTRGQKVDVDASAAVLAPLAAGEMSLHHVRIVHGSLPNKTDDRRIGMVLRYCAAHVRQTKVHDTAVLVAGDDTHGHFELLPPPAVDLGEAERARHLDAVRRMSKALYAD